MEVELKFRIAPRDIERLRRCPALRGIRPRRRSMLALYFDTPDELLAAHGMALRVRREGQRWVQALKGGGRSGGALHARDEWEARSADGSLDLARLRHTPLAGLPGAERLHERLSVLFQVEVERTTWLARPARGVKLEVALDVGAVRHADASDAVSEVEIECKAGPDDAAFEFAGRLLAQVPLVPSAVTKAQRGYRLVHGEQVQPAHAQPATVEPDMSVGEGASAVLAAALAQLLANAEGIATGADPEFVHQLRVALRRLRSALRVFRRPLGKFRVRELRAPLRGITRQAGRARDLGRALASRGFARAVLEVARMLHAAPAATDARGLRDYMAARLRKAERALRRVSASFETLDAAARHRVRIDAKRLRYALDACAGLFPRKRVKEYGAVLARLQDALGDANDARVGAGLLQRLRAPRALATAGAACLVQQENEARHRASLALERLLRTAAPWGKR
ncbi:MAG TPA: CHAD domain-containing protein [Usitatibacter sp.]|jgi:inorganic triphosphatase YgiF|nr:CHAD domain-containing protein [Usitatibacter sp.]